MKVRCPVCHTVHPEPPHDFACEGCGRRLAWRPMPSPLIRGEQMSLFVPDGGAEPLALPLTVEHAARSKRREPRPDAPEVAAEGEAQPTAGLSSDALARASRAVALLTATLALQSEGEEMISAVLAEEAPGHFLELSLAVAWLATTLISELDEAQDGAGTAWLQGMAVRLAALAEGGDGPGA